MKPSKTPSPNQRFPVQGAGLGLRHELIEPMRESRPEQVGFIEVAPENWMRVGGLRAKSLRELTERYPLVCHGLSLSIGGPAPLDDDFLRELKGFLDSSGARAYTEHLSYCGDQGQLYDLMPIPFTEDAVHWVVARIRHVQDVLERRIGMENVSTYAMPAGELNELEFLTAVLDEADCGLHLDVNNVFVNSVNHGMDARAFIESIPAERILYAHIAGHFREEDDLRVDTHGEDVIPEVWDLLDLAYARHGVFPTLLERDFNIPPLEELLGEVDEIVRHQRNATAEAGSHVA